MTPLLLQIHDWLRWAVLAAGVLSAVVSTITWLGRRPAGGADTRLSGLFVGLLDLQWIVGFVLLLFLLQAPELQARLYHGGLMTAAVFTAHLVRLRVRRSTPQAAPPHFVVGALFPLLIIALGLRLWYA